MKSIYLEIEYRRIETKEFNIRNRSGFLCAIYLRKLYYCPYHKECLLRENRTH